MGDAMWGRQGAMYPPPAGALKRPRTDYPLPHPGLPHPHQQLPHDLAPQMASGIDMREYIIRDNDRGVPRAANDPKAIGSTYDHYLQRTDVPLYNAVEATALSAASLGRGIPVAEPTLLGRPGVMVPDGASNGRDVGHGGQLLVDANPRSARENVPLPTDASNTLYIEGLPPNSSKREVAHIFRPFVGYKEVRLVTKESKRRGGDPLILCFVDFVDAACAATALSALQGYRMDEDDRDSNYLRIQFSRHPGPRSAPVSRGRR